MSSSRSQTDIRVRKASLQDVRQLAEFNRKMAMETEQIALQPDVILCGVQRLIEDENRGFYLVAETKDELVASLMVTKEWSDWRNGEFWWIQSVYVIESWRRCGVYTLLYQTVKDLSANRSDVCGYRLYVEKDNAIAQSTYLKSGMHETAYLLYEELKPTTRFIL